MHLRQGLKWTLLLTMSLILVMNVSCQKKTVAVEMAADSTAREDRTGSYVTGSTDDREDTLNSAAVDDHNEPEFVLKENIFFEFDKATLTPEARETLIDNGKWLRMNADVVLTIEGHCDERGTNGYNLALGDRRAENVKTFLIDLGVDDSRITTISYGEERPLDRGHGETAWAKNRRAHFLIR